MRSFKVILVMAALSVVMTSCVTTSKKYKALDAQFKQMEFSKTDCDSKLTAAKTAADRLGTQNGYLQSQVDDLKKQLDDAKKNNAQVLNTLQDMSVLSNKQAESVKQTLQSMGEKDNLINGLQSAMARKDSLNMSLVMNLKGAIGDLNDKDINIKVDKSAVYIDISDKMLFTSGKASVNENAKVVLGKVAKVLSAQPDVEFLVEGHTDSISIHTDCVEDNWDLSVRRATAIVRILQKQYGISPSRMTAAGRSQYLPLDSNDTAEGRARNRRTRIVILPQLDQFFKLLVRK